MNEHLNMTFLPLSLSLPSQYVNPSKNEPINGHDLECGVTDTRTPVTALGMYMYTI
jgi:hypothetical protein